MVSKPPNQITNGGKTPLSFIRTKIPMNLIRHSNISFETSLPFKLAQSSLEYWAGGRPAKYGSILCFVSYCYGYSLLEKHTDHRNLCANDPHVVHRVPLVPRNFHHLLLLPVKRKWNVSFRDGDEMGG